MNAPRIYADTSVFGGCFDEDFADESKLFFEHVRSGNFLLIISETTLWELRDAPERVRNLLVSLPAERMEILTITEEIEDLREAYLAAEVVGSALRLDAEHIAAATVSKVDLIIVTDRFPFIHRWR